MHRTLLAVLASGLLVAALTGCTMPGSASSGQIMAPVSSANELGPQDGYIPTGDTVKLTDRVPAITRLVNPLKDALIRAAASAAERHVTFTFTNGWRSERYQQFLFDQAVIEYGSEEEASRWVKRGNQSKHVRGEAVDIATADAMDWLTRFGAEYGLCQIYSNEIWHYEYVADAASSETCPPAIADASAG